MSTTTKAPAGTTINDAVAATPAAGHAPDFLAVHAVQLGLSKLERPMTIAELADEDGVLTAVVEVSLFDMMEGRANEESGEDCPIVREMVDEVIGTSPTNMLTLVARFDLREALRVPLRPGGARRDVRHHSLI